MQILNILNFKRNFLSFLLQRNIYVYFFVGLIFSFYENTYALENLEKKKQNFVIQTKKITIPGYEDAFNPSIVEWKGKVLMSFRTRDPKTLQANRVGLVWLNKKFEVTEKAVLLDIPGTYIQDPRLIFFNGSLYMAYSDLVPLDGSRKMCLVELFYDGMHFHAKQPEFLLDFQANKERKFEKNWVPFVYKDCLLLSYTLFPHRVFFPLFGEKKCVTVDTTEASSECWKLGSIRGGTTALNVGDRYLGFFHSSVSLASEESEGKEMPHYFMGAYTFSLNPPFNMIQLSGEPIVGKSFYSKTLHKTWKPLKVVFPAGFIFNKKYIWVSYGKQDHEAWVIQLDKNELLNSLQNVSSF